MHVTFLERLQSFSLNNIDTQIILNHVKIYLDTIEVFLLIK